MTKEKKSWFEGPYPWLVSAAAFLLPSINYFSKGDYSGGAIFFISTVMFFVMFLGKLRKK